MDKERFEILKSILVKIGFHTNGDRLSISMPNNMEITIDTKEKIFRYESTDKTVSIPLPGVTTIYKLKTYYNMVTGLPYPSNKQNK